MPNSEFFISDPAVLENFEFLIRSLLIRPDQPAVVILGHFSPQIQNSVGFVGPDHWHTVVAQFYDVPHIRYDIAQLKWHMILTIFQCKTTSVL